jgi:hypothetical protein
MFPLADLWNSSVGQSPELANLLEAFTNAQVRRGSFGTKGSGSAHTQLNAVMSNATIAGSNIYSLEWSGPPATDYSLGGSSAALAAFIAAIGPNPTQHSGLLAAARTSPHELTCIVHKGLIPRYLGEP